jgi:hypothetical protein
MGIDVPLQVSASAELQRGTTTAMVQMVTQVLDLFDTHSEYATQAPSPDEPPPPPQTPQSVSAAGLCVADGHVKLQAAVQLDKTGRGNPRIPLPPVPPMPPEARVAWRHRDDTVAIANALPPAMVERLRSALARLVADDVMVTPLGGVASGKRCRLSTLHPTNPTRITCSVAGGATADGTVQRLRYAFHRMGVGADDLVCQPMPDAIFDVCALVQSLLSSVRGSPDPHEKLALAVQINVNKAVSAVDFHHDNATPGPGGQVHNSQRYGSATYVYRLSATAGAPVRQTIKFKCAQAA